MLQTIAAAANNLSKKHHFQFPLQSLFRSLSSNQATSWFLRLACHNDDLEVFKILTHLPHFDTFDIFDMLDKYLTFYIFL